MTDYFLKHIDKFEYKTKANIILECIEGTSIEEHKEFYTQIATDVELSSVLYYQSKYGIMLDKASDDFSEEYLDELIVNIKKEHRKYKLQEAIVDEDLDEIRALVNTNVEYNSKLEEPKSVRQMYEEASKKDSQGLTTGIYEVDEPIGAIPFGSVVTVGAGPGHFKTTSALNICYNAVMNEGYNCLYIGLEDLERNYRYTLMGRHGYQIGKKLETRKMKINRLSPAEVKRLVEIEEDYESKKKGELYVMTLHDLNNRHLNFETAVDSLVRQFDKQFGLDIIVFDHCQLLKYYQKKGIQDPKERMNYFIRLFSAYATALNNRGVIVILLSQLNREALSTLGRKGRANLTMFAEANELERTSSYMWVQYASDEDKINNQMNVSLIKSRNGETFEELKPTVIEPRYGVVGQNSAFNSYFNSADASKILSEITEDEVDNYFKL